MQGRKEGGQVSPSGLHSAVPGGASRRPVIDVCPWRFRSARASCGGWGDGEGREMENRQGVGVSMGLMQTAWLSKNWILDCDTNFFSLWPLKVLQKSLAGSKRISH